MPPLIGLVKPLLADDATVTALIAPGRSEHGYEFTPGDIAQLGKADVVVYIGAGLEPAVAKFLADHPNSNRQDVCFESVAGIVLDPDEHEKHSANEHEHHGPDPHLWLDPGLCAKLVDSAAAAVKKAAESAGNAAAA